MRKYRSIRGLSQAKLAESANIATAYVAMIELEKKFPSVNVLERIAHALKIDPTELFSKTCYPAEAIKELHLSVLHGIDQVIKNHIIEFETKVHNGEFNVPIIEPNTSLYEVSQR